MSAQKFLDKKTYQIINKLESDLSGFYSHFRLDLNSVCEHYKISLLEGEFEDGVTSGALSNDNDAWSIVVNKNESEERVRFTIAHELGHYFSIIQGSEIAKAFIEDSDGVIKDSIVVNRSINPTEDIYQAERQANMIGASLLMPEAMVKSLFEKNVPTSDMAKQFGVSESALFNRLRSLNLVNQDTFQP